MNSTQRNLVLAAVLIGCLPSICHANPVAIPVAPFVVVPLLLILEGVIIVLMAGSAEPYRLRFVTIWFLITLLTFVGLYLLVALADSFSDNGYASMPVLALILGECVVTIVEGAAIWCLLRWKFLARNRAHSPSFLGALAYSVTANAFSLGGSLLSFLITIGVP